MRRSIGPAMVATSLLLMVLAAWLLVRGRPGGEPRVAPVTSVAVRPAAATPAPESTSPAGATAVATSSGPAAATPVAGAASTPAQSAVSPVVTASEDAVRRVTVLELQRMLGGPNPPLVWDIRAADEFEKQHIPGSKAIGLYDIPELANDLDRKQPIVTLCA